MTTSVSHLNPSLRLATLYGGVLLCAVLAAWSASVGLGFHVAPRTPSAALIRDVAAPTSPRPSRTHSPLSAVSVATTAPRAAASSTSNAPVAPSSNAHAAATKFVPVTHNVEVITPSQNDNSSTNSSAGNSSTDSSDGDSSASSSTTTLAGD